MNSQLKPKRPLAATKKAQRRARAEVGKNKGANGGSATEDSEDEAELSLAEEMSHQEDEENENTELLNANEKLLSGTDSIPKNPKRKPGSFACAARHRKAQCEAAADRNKGKVTPKQRRQNLAGQVALKNQERTPKALLNTACPSKKKYPWMESADADHSNLAGIYY